VKTRAPHKIGCKCNVCKLKRGEPHKVDCNCIACRLIRGEGKNKGNPNYKHGRYIKKRCPVCNKLLTSTAKTCQRHKLISLTTRKKMSLSRKTRKISPETGKKISLKSKERWKDANYRIKMGLAISKGMNTPESKVRRSKVSKNLWKQEDYRKKVLIEIFKALNLRPNKPEQILLNLLQIILTNQYKYTGDGSFFIERYNPDFIDFKNKKIIECYGTYWHNRTDSIKRDKRRLKIYKKNNYKTLIIWDEELKDVDKLIAKLLKFRNLM
jgi:very-short-patch-repair endonuclease